MEITTVLSKFDDYPIHQTAEPVFHTATSDRNTYDRFWYNGHARDGSFYFGVGLCGYPNLGILDCSLSLAIDGRQYAFHGSRRAPLEPTDTTVGPFALHILEPMGRHRVAIGPNETGIECDLVFTPHTACIEEGRQTMRNQRHLIMDVTRLDQFGSWEGWIRYDGKRLKVDGHSTFGLKDRSWGVRPVGEAEPAGIRADDVTDAQAIAAAVCGNLTGMQFQNIVKSKEIQQRRNLLSKFFERLAETLVDLLAGLTQFFFPIISRRRSDTYGLYMGHNIHRVF